VTHSGQQAGSYVLLERIGMGGMAEVFRAANRGVEGFERPVAIKRILPNLAADEDFVKMFVDEAKIAVQLQHPNIVEIFDLARADDDLFIAMEYVHGKDLRAILDKVQGPDGRRGRLPVEISVHVTARICDALHHAHFAHGASGQPLGIIHRDVSPQNVIVSYDGEVKVTDFGLAKAAGRAVQTQAGVVKGKLAYMSPEQLRGQAIDQRSDVYGVGILLWEMLTATRLFLGKNDQETLRRVYHAQVPPPRTVCPDLHPELEAIVMRALAREVSDRYPTAEEMQEDLTSFLYGVGPATSTPGVSAFMRHLYPQADPVPAPSSHPPAARRGDAHITARGLSRGGGHHDDAPTGRPQPGITNAPPRRRDGSSQLRPNAVEMQHLGHGHDPRGHDPHGHDPHGHDRRGHDRRGHDPHGQHDPHGHDPHGQHDPHGHDPHDLSNELSPSRPPISLDDLEDLVEEELVESPPARRVTRAIRPQEVEEGSEFVRTVLHRAIAASTAQTRPPPARTDLEEETNRGYQVQPQAEPVPGFHQEVSVTSQNQPRVFRRPGSSLSAPRVPSIESLIEEALHADDDVPQATHPFAPAYVPHGEPVYEEHTQSVETDEFGEPPTMVGNEDELARAHANGWDAELTPQRSPRRR
jgi:hypothetical protein